jgi:hypothetical protein
MAETDRNAAQLKDDIDRGRAGDKVGGFDPAAAPLGTDDEAGGAAPDIHSHQIRPGASSAGANAAQPELAPDARGAPKPVMTPLVIGVGAAVVLGGLLLIAL